MPTSSDLLATLLPILLKDVVIPEVLLVIKARQSAGGSVQDLTSDQVIAMLGDHVTRFKNIGQAFLDATRPTVGQP